MAVGVFGTKKNNKFLVVIQLQGGLGNQMFQYAASKALSLKNRDSLLLDVSFIEEHSQTNESFTAREYALDIFTNIQEEIVSLKNLNKFRRENVKWKDFSGIKYPKIFRERSLSFDPSFFSLRPPVLLQGYFQSENYFKDFEKDIRNSFSFQKLQAEDDNIPVLEEIKNSCSVSVHIRRTDYLKPAINKVHGVCSLEYYQQAIEIMKNKNSNARFFFFADDKDWVCDRFRGTNMVSVQNNSGKDSWKDMYLMSQCKHHIVANSSFSWWGAWLNKHKEKIVICPEKWIKNDDELIFSNSIIPKDWIRVG